MSDEQQFSQSLRKHYQAIGEALLSFEKLVSFYPNKVSRCKLFFQTEVAFVPTEVMESYLDDLLDLGIKEVALYIKPPLRNYLLASLIIGGLIAAFSLGLYAATNGSSWLFSFALMSLTAAPFILLWQLFPVDRLSRRMYFAKLLTQEVARRRGDDVFGDKTSSGWLGFIKPGVRPLPDLPRKIG